MSRIEEMIRELCPEGVEYKQLWEVTVWDKKFNAVERNKQKKVYSYKYLLASELFDLEQENGDVRLLSTGEYIGWTTEELAGEYLYEGEIVTIPWGKSIGAKNPIKYYKGKFVTADNRIATSLNTSILSNKYLYYWMMSQSDAIDKFYRGAGIKHPNMKDVLDMEIPVPPLAIQHEIVNILDKFTELEAELEARRKQYEYYRNKLLSFNGITPPLKNEVKWLAMSEVFEMKNGYTPSKAKPEYWTNGTIPWFRMEDIRMNGRILSDSIQHITPEAVKGGRLFPANSIIVATTATIGEHALIIADSLANQQFTNLSIRKSLIDELDMKFFFYYMFIVDEWCKNNTNTSGFESVDMAKFKKLMIPIPPMAEQRRIVAILDKFEVLVNDISEGLPAEIAARRRQYEYYRDQLLTFKHKEDGKIQPCS